MMPTNKKYREKLQASIKKISDVVKDIEILTMTTAISDSDRDIFTSGLDQQVRKIKQALRSDPLDMELDWGDESESEKAPKSSSTFDGQNKNETEHSSIR
jgi:hypothetical protein